MGVGQEPDFTNGGNNPAIINGCQFFIQILQWLGIVFKTKDMLANALRNSR